MGLVILSIGYLVLTLVQGATKGKRRSRGNLALLMGQCGSGKTTTFFRLREPHVEEPVTTVSSLKPLREVLQLRPGEDKESFGPVEVVDFPGHLRMRGKQNKLVPEARCIVYMIDSEDKQRLKDVAENFYELLTNQDIIELHTPILIACNKADLNTAKTEKAIIEEIEREIEQMRVSRGATLEGQDQADSYLGLDGVKFKLLEHAPCPIETCRISAKKNNLDPLYDFLRQQFP